VTGSEHPDTSLAEQSRTWRARTPELKQKAETPYLRFETAVGNDDPTREDDQARRSVTIRLLFETQRTDHTLKCSLTDRLSTDDFLQRVLAQSRAAHPATHPVRGQLLTERRFCDQP
jgi:hypothetical protein